MFLPLLTVFSVSRRDILNWPWPFSHLKVAETQNPASHSHPTNEPESTKEMPFA